MVMNTPMWLSLKKKYIADDKQYWQQSWMYEGEELDILVWVDPEILGENKGTVFIFH